MLRSAFCRAQKLLTNTFKINRMDKFITRDVSQEFPHLDDSWKTLLKDEIECEYFKCLWEFVEKQYAKNQPIYPAYKNIFAAFNLTPLENVKAVILGQDPYHGKNQAHGLSFSVQNGVKYPPSLTNIFKECCNDVGINYPLNGNLTKWAEQGVLLLNSILTVAAGKPRSHENKGWEKFTDRVISLTSQECEFVVFVLWGNFAKEKKHLIDKRHTVIECVHPSPFSARRGFFGSKPFTKINEALKKNGIKPIDWRL